VVKTTLDTVQRT